MRLATYNVEWFNALFDDENRPLHDHEWSARHDVTRAQQLDALGAVFRRLDVDGIVIVEAPDTRQSRRTDVCLLNFAAAYDLRVNEVVTGFLNGTQQEIAFLFDNRVLSARHQPGGGPDVSPRFDGSFLWDVDVDGMPEAHMFSKPPLELHIRGGGFDFRLIGVHVKSKAPHGAESPADAVRISIANRRKQLAQCVWIRRRVNELLEPGENVIVAGDFNDGPGLDAYEKLFGRSGVEIVLGECAAGEAALFDPHADARLDAREAWSPATARFFDRKRRVYMNALLDFIMISNSLRTLSEPKWRIWHPFDDETCFSEPAFQRALLTASDHYPVTLDFGPGTGEPSPL